MRKQIIHIRLLPLLFAASGFLVSCGESLEDRAAREAKEFTEKFCPTPVQMMRAPILSLSTNTQKPIPTIAH